MTNVFTWGRLLDFHRYREENLKLRWNWKGLLLCSPLSVSVGVCVCVSVWTLRHAITLGIVVKTPLWRPNSAHTFARVSLSWRRQTQGRCVTAPVWPHLSHDGSVLAGLGLRDGPEAVAVVAGRFFSRGPRDPLAQGEEPDRGHSSRPVLSFLFQPDKEAGGHFVLWLVASLCVRGTNKICQAQGSHSAWSLKNLCSVFLWKPDQKKFGYSPSKVHLIGHSVGAHLAGEAGSRVPGLGRITGKPTLGVGLESLPCSSTHKISVWDTSGSSGSGYKIGGNGAQLTWQRFQSRRVEVHVRECSLRVTCGGKVSGAAHPAVEGGLWVTTCAVPLQNEPEPHWRFWKDVRDTSGSQLTVDAGCVNCAYALPVARMLTVTPRHTVKSKNKLQTRVCIHNELAQFRIYCELDFRGRSSSPFPALQLPN